jgi:hypothetical protein
MSPDLKPQMDAEGHRAGTVTQCEIILARLEQARGAWVPMVELAAEASCYAVHSRIADLRRRGHRIPPPRQTRVGRACHTEYQLLAPGS